MDDSVIMCHEVIESYDEEKKTIPTSFNEDKAICKMQNILAFLLITLALLIAVSIYCYLIKQGAKEKHFHNTNNELKQGSYQ